MNRKQVQIVAQSDTSGYWNDFTRAVFPLTLSPLYAWEASLASAVTCARIPRACGDEEWSSCSQEASCTGTSEADGAEEVEVDVWFFPVLTRVEGLVAISNWLLAKSYMLKANCLSLVASTV